MALKVMYSVVVMTVVLIPRGISAAEADAEGAERSPAIPAISPRVSARQGLTRNDESTTVSPNDEDEVWEEFEEAQLPGDSSGSGRHDRTWPNATIPYVLRASKKLRKDVLKVLTELQESTCLRFMERREGEARYLFIRGAKTGECWASSVGYPKGKNKVIVSLGPGCKSRKPITHEILHAVGLVHEHSRPDRDKYLTVNWNNVKKGAKPRFKKDRRYTTLSVPYDPRSIMHYSKNAFAKDHRQPTLVPKQPLPGPLGGSRLSHLDKLRINTLYDCHLSPASA